MIDMQRLLVVDDSPTVRKLVELTFRGTAWRIDFASSGGEALNLVKTAAPDVVLLDFVLPDMRGVDVCSQLAKERDTADIPVVVMSGKDSISEVFQNFRSVTSCLTKPSTPEKIRAAVEAARAGVSTQQPSATKSATILQKEAAAKALYGLLRDAFAKIPSWMEELGEKAAAPYFARKILTPQRTGDLIEALIPHLRGVLMTPPPGPGPALATDASFQGAVRSWPVAALISFFESSARTGTLTFQVGEKETVAYVRGGEVVAVTCRDPFEYQRGLRWPNQKPIPAEAMRAAAAEQERSGTPVIVTLAMQGHFPPNSLTNVLASQGRRLLMSVLDATAASFAWRDVDVLPAYVEAHGRHISTVRNTLRFGPDAPEADAVPSRQRELEQLRQTPSQRQVEPELVFARPRGFSELVQQFSLTADERQVLGLIDGRHTVDELARWAGLEPKDMAALLARLSEVQLVIETGAPSMSAHEADVRARPVMILEPDTEGFERPLASLLQDRADPIRLMSLAGEQDLVAAIRRERPSIVLLNPAATPAEDTVRRIRAEPELADVVLVAVLEPEMGASSERLTSSGFNSVLVKPVAREDIDHLFA